MCAPPKGCRLCHEACVLLETILPWLKSLAVAGKCSGTLGWQHDMRAARPGRKQAYSPPAPRLCLYGA